MNKITDFTNPLDWNHWMATVQGSRRTVALSGGGSSSGSSGGGGSSSSSSSR